MKPDTETKPETVGKEARAQYDRAAMLGFRMLVLTNQLGHVARDIQHYIVQEEHERDRGDMRIAQDELSADMSDLVAQIYTLALELGYDEEGWAVLLKRGLEQMGRRKMEYQAKGWVWI